MGSSQFHFTFAGALGASVMELALEGENEFPTQKM